MREMGGDCMRSNICQADQEKFSLELKIKEMKATDIPFRTIVASGGKLVSGVLPGPS